MRSRKSRPARPGSWPSTRDVARTSACGGPRGSRPWSTCRRRSRRAGRRPRPRRRRTTSPSTARDRRRSRFARSRTAIAGIAGGSEPYAAARGRDRQAGVVAQLLGGRVEVAAQRRRATAVGDVGVGAARRSPPRRRAVMCTSQRSRSSRPMWNGRWRMRRRGWPRSSEYVVGPPQYCTRNSRSRWRAPVRSGASGYRRSEHLVAGDAVVERVDEALEERLAADDLVEQRRRPAIASVTAATVPSPPWPPTRHRERSCPPAIADYIADRTAPPDDVLVRAAGPHGRARARRRHADRRRPGRPAHAAHPPRRRPPAVEVGTFTGLLVDLHRPRPGARRPPAVLRRQRGVHGDRPRGVGRGRARPTASSCASPRPSRRCGPCPTEATIDLAFIDADKGGYAAYFDELRAPRPRPAACCSSTTRCGRAASSTTRPTTPTRVAIKAFNDKVAADDRVESYILPIGDGLTLIRKR